jgi:hypothetical protein
MRIPIPIEDVRIDSLFREERPLVVYFKRHDLCDGSSLGNIEIEISFSFRNMEKINRNIRLVLEIPDELIIGNPGDKLNENN